jgi:predicted nucleotidyltransferase component of viral defense system
MITKQEIMDFSVIMGLRPDVVEKDYALGWILAGIHAAKPATAQWIFKGGTCLKKCFFETYRFSEDLDFTLTPNSSITAESLADVIRNVSEWVNDASGLVIPQDSVEIKVNPRGKGSFVGKIGYIGPLSKQQGGTYKIKFDFSADEILVLQPIVRDVVHPYSDKDPSSFNVTSYAYEELFAEKIRALSERLRPRDLYDVIHLYRHRDMLPNKATLLKTLTRKCKFKQIEVPTFESIDSHTKKEELYAEWKNMLDHQLQMLPESEVFWDELPSFFDWLHETKPTAEPAELKIYNGESPWVPKIDRSQPAIFGPIQKIQFAAANRICIKLDYHHKTRTIEPISFRQSRTGKILFYGFERESNQSKSFHVEEFGKIELTHLPYQPKYPVEISTVGPISAPPISRGHVSTSGALSSRVTRNRGNRPT